MRILLLFLLAAAPLSAKTVPLVVLTADPVPLTTVHLKRGSLPEAEYVSDRIVSLPLFPAMTDDDARDVVAAVCEVCAKAAR